MSKEPEDWFLTTEEVARRYRTTNATVHAWNYHRTGPPSIRVGKRRLYRLSDLEAWEAAARAGDRQLDAAS